MSRKWIAAALAAVTMVAGHAVVAAPPALADGSAATINMPFDGYWDRFGVSHPSYHGPAGNSYADWATDLYASPGTQVRANLSGPSLQLKVAGIGATCGSAGRTVSVDVYTNGQRVGNARYGHLSNVAVSEGQTIGSGTVLGTTNQYAYQAGCWEVTNNNGVHTHFTAFNYVITSTTYACYHDRGSGTFQTQSASIGLTGGSGASAAKSPCPSAPPPPDKDPFGHVDQSEGGAGTFRVRGWAIDPSDKSVSIDVHVYIGGKAGTAGTDSFSLLADEPRPDVGDAYPGAGDNHGFDHTRTTDRRGTHEVCIYAINIGSGSNRLLSCANVNITEPTSPEVAVTPATGDENTRFEGTASGFTPNSTASLRVTDPSGSEYATNGYTKTRTVDGSGKFTWVWFWESGDRFGTYKFEATDQSGKKAAVTFTIEDSSAPPPTELDPSTTYERLVGGDRYATAAAVSARHFGPGVAVAFIAVGTNFPDALSAGPAAARNRSPILLTLRDQLPASTRAELDRLNPARIVVMGSTAAVSNQVESELAGYTQGPVMRLSGRDRYQTAALLSEEYFPSGVAVAFVATGQNFADSLASTPAAASVGAPVLLVGQDAIPPSTGDELVRLNPSRIVIVGGPSAVSEDVRAALGAYTDGSVTRVAGSNRYETAVKVSSTYFPGSRPQVVIATGQTFPDAVTGGAAAGTHPTALLLVTRECAPGAVVDEVVRLAPDTILTIGGAASVSDSASRLTRC